MQPLQPAPALAQNSTVAGTLTNALSGDPVPNALVTLQSGSTSRQVRSGTDGKYSFSESAAGSVRPDRPARRFSAVAELRHRERSDDRRSDIQLSPELHFTEVMSVSPEAKDSFVSFQSTESLGGQQLTQELAADARRDAREPGRGRSTQLRSWPRASGHPRHGR